MFQRLTVTILLLCLAVAAAAASHADSPSPEAVVRSFHEALRAGDAAAVRQLLAPDATIAENGDIESRDEYLDRHLSADIEFAKSVPTTRLASRATLHGETAWVSTASTSSGTFGERTVRLVGAELMVLTRTATSWEVRAIHWSSRAAK